MDKLDQLNVELWIPKSLNNFRRDVKMTGGELNYRQQVLDEICLEGLSGITLQVKS